MEKKYTVIRKGWIYRYVYQSKGSKEKEGFAQPPSEAKNILKFENYDGFIDDPLHAYCEFEPVKVSIQAPSKTNSLHYEQIDEIEYDRKIVVPKIPYRGTYYKYTAPAWETTFESVITGTNEPVQVPKVGGETSMSRKCFDIARHYIVVEDEGKLIRVPITYEQYELIEPGTRVRIKSIKSPVPEVVIL